MNIPIKYLIEALKNLPIYSNWDKDEFIFQWQSVSPEKCCTIIFVKNKKTYQWELKH
jgi:hypothetical protein